jgi:hypothetical protein
MKTIEIREKALGAGKWVSGSAWHPAGALIATIQIAEPIHPDTLRELLNRIERPAPSHPGLVDEVAWVTEVTDSE